MPNKTVLILGGGYGGLACLRTLARKLDRTRYRIRLIDAEPHHTIKTRFHERAVLESRDFLIRFPLNALVRASGAEFVQDEIQSLDLPSRYASGKRGRYGYDRVVIAMGGHIAYFGVEGAREHTVSLQTYRDACECARRLKRLRLGRPGSPRRRIVVCGAGIEGLEVAAMVRQHASSRHCEVTVVERSEAVMARSQCRESQRQYLLRYLKRRDIGVRLGATIRNVDPRGVHLESGESIAADLVYWCAGVRRVEVEGTQSGVGFQVNRSLQRTDHPEVFALGDFATVDSRQEFSNLASAQRAVYHGQLVGENLRRYETLRPLRPARYRPLGELIALGDLDGVGIIRGIPVTGLAAAVAKKVNEVKYLAELCRDLPRSFLRRLRSRPELDTMP
jgi:NADH dehydrogenase